jgi:hypothetical protein
MLLFYTAYEKLCKYRDNALGFGFRAGLLTVSAEFDFTFSAHQRKRFFEMTQMEVVYRYGTAPGEAGMRALDNIREVYGVRGIRFNEKDRSVRVEFDASRFKEPVIAALLRQAGIDVQERVALA